MTNATVSNVTIQQRNILIIKASKAKNPFESLPDVLRYKTDSAEYVLYSRMKNDMDGKTLKWAFKLAERNVSPFYKQLSMGWQPKVKQSDLNKSWARYLIAVDANKTPVAYSMFRFDLDYGHSVLYCYEMQIEPAAQRKGLGKHMMMALEQCAKHWKMEKVVLTVLKNNDNARAFFKTIGYTLDDTSPDIREKEDYEILSKIINIA